MAKEKKEEVRSNPNPPIIREFSSGGVVFKKTTDGKYLWLVAKSRPSKLYPDDVWRLPKGRLDDRFFGLKPGPKAKGIEKATEEDIQKTAIREVKEEGGVKAKIIKKIATEKFFYTSRETKERILKFVTFYLMEYVSDIKGLYLFESEKVEFLEDKEAIKKLSYSGEKKILKIATEMVN